MRHFLFAVIVATLFLPAFAQAAVFSAQGPSVVAADGAFEARVVVHTQGEALNAFEGELVFSPEALTLERILTGSSIVSLWIEEPFEVSTGRWRFSGVTPGGYNGSQGLIFRARFVPRQIGGATLTLENAYAFLNDGQGTQTSVRGEALSISVRAQAVAPVPEIEADVEPPEAFTPILTRDPSLFEGKYFLVFLTQDKESGVDHYEVKEGLHGFVAARSPYVLRNQRLNTDIVVKAIDKSGNERIARLAATQPFGRMGAWQTWVGALIIILIGVLGGLWRRKQKIHFGG